MRILVQKGVLVTLLTLCISQTAEANKCSDWIIRSWLIVSTADWKRNLDKPFSVETLLLHYPELKPEAEFLRSFELFWKSTWWPRGAVSRIWEARNTQGRLHGFRFYQCDRGFKIYFDTGGDAEAARRLRASVESETLGMSVSIDLNGVSYIADPTANHLTIRLSGPMLDQIRLFRQILAKMPADLLEKPGPGGISLNAPRMKEEIPEQVIPLDLSPVIYWVPVTRPRSEEATRLMSDGDTQPHYP